MKLKVGDTIPPISVTTIHEVALAIPDTNSAYIHLQFRRFAGCPVCNFHLQSLSKRATEIRVAGIREIAVFHASRDEMLQYHAQLPFDCVPDPGKELFRKFGVETSIFSLLHPAVLWVGLRGVLATGKFYYKNPKMAYLAYLQTTLSVRKEKFLLPTTVQTPMTTGTPTNYFISSARRRMYPNNSFKPTQFRGTA